MEDKEFVRQFTTVLSVLVVIAVLIFMIAKIVTSIGHDEGNPLISKAIEERIQPVAQVYIGSVPKDVLAEASSSAGGSDLSTGKGVYEQVCAACHGAGVAGAPKFGDAAAWEPRLAQGKDALYASALNGKGAMPVKGGRADLTDQQIMDAVDYMASQSGGESATPPAVAAPTQDSQTPAADAAASQNTQVTATEASSPASGKTNEIYDAVCGNCHNSGVAGAPKFADVEAWKPRIEQGKEALYHSAIAGKGVMPAKGGRADLSDEDVKHTVDYMIENATK